MLPSFKKKLMGGHADKFVKVTTDLAIFLDQKFSKFRIFQNMSF